MEKKRSSRGRRGGRRRSAPAKVQTRMLMNVIDPEEIRVALVSPDGLDELYVESTGGGYLHGNIYKGKVQNVEPSLQAAFIDIGGEKNGFLHASDVIPPHGGYEGVLKKRRRKAPEDMRKMPIEKLLYKGQEVLVQITRESLATKGPSLTTYISLPGRYLVLMPAIKKRGVSRKIVDEKERTELKRELDALDPPKDYGFIIRTAGMGRGPDALKRDLDYLTRLWDAILARTKKVKSPAVIYQESDLLIRAIRDYLGEEVSQVVVDRAEEAERAKEFLRAVMPAFEDRVILHEEATPLFHHYGVEDAFSSIVARSVPLKSGGEIIIEQTEAMVTIDVNSGKFKSDNTREMILTINKEAAVEIARQLRFRDLGGLIMIDFIDMDLAEDRREVERVIGERLRQGRARVTVLPISQLGILEMTRQRVRKSLRRSLYTVCADCAGSGLQKSPEFFRRELIRRLRIEVADGAGVLKVFLHPDNAEPVANGNRATISALEAAHTCQILVLRDKGVRRDEMRFIWETRPSD